MSLPPDPVDVQIRRNRLIQGALAFVIVIALVGAVAAVLIGRGGSDAVTKKPPTSGALARFDYAKGLSRWKDVQEPEGQSRVTVVDAPRSPDGSRPGPRAMRAEVRPGDRTNTGGYIASRSEVYGRSAPSGTAPEDWPDPVGSTRWYEFSLFVPRGFCLSEDDANWLTFTQWKGLSGGSPPVALEIKRGNLELGGSHMRRPLGRVTPGRWTRLTVGLTFSPDPSKGSVVVRRDGKTVVPRTRFATMDTREADGMRTADPIYLKQGLYRARSWTCSQALLFSPMTVATTARALHAAA